MSGSSGRCGRSHALLAAGAFAFVPEAALCGVLIFIGMRIFRVSIMRHAEYVRGRLMDSIAAMDPPCRLVVIEAHGVSDIDFTGSQVLQHMVTELCKQNIEITLRGWNPTAHRMRRHIQD